MNLPNVFYKATTTTDIKIKQGQKKEKYKQYSCEPDSKVKGNKSQNKQTGIHQTKASAQQGKTSSK